MGESVFCSICSMSIGIRIITSILIIFHVMLGILPFLFSNITTMANFFLLIFCSTPSQYQDTDITRPLPPTAISCRPIQLLLCGLCVPYCLVFNSLLLLSHTSLLVSGWDTKWLSVSYSVIHTTSAVQLVSLGSFVIHNFVERQEVVCWYPF